MSDFTLSTLITADDTSLVRALASSREQVRLFGSEVNSSVGKSSQAVGKQLPADFDRAGRAAEKFGSQTRKGMREAEAAAEDLATRGGRSMSSFAGIIGRFAGPTSIAALAVQIGKTGIGFQDFTARNEMAFESMLGSAEAAKSYMADVLAFAKQTPFSFPELTQSAQQMISFGVDSKNVIGILRDLGDAAVGAGGGIEEVKGLATVIGQISAKGRLQNEEILQLAERGIPALRVLANQAGLTTAEYQKQVTAGAVSSEQAISNLTKGLREGTNGVNGMTAAYGGLMEKQKESGIFSSNWDSIKSGFRNMSAAITESLLPILLDLMDSLQEVMKFISTLAGFFNSLPGPLKTATVAFVAFTAANRLFGNASERAVLGVGKFISSMRSLYLEQVKAKGGMVFNGSGAHAADNFGRTVATAGTRAKAGFAVMTAGAKGATSALLGVFGGPVGLAVTGGLALITAGMSAHSKEVEAAKARLEEYKATLDETTGAITENTREWAKNQLLTEAKGGQTFGLGGTTATLLEDTKAWGLSVADMQTALEGNVDTAKELMAQVKQIVDTNWGPDAAYDPSRADKNLDSYERIMERLQGIVKDQEKLNKEKQQQAEIDAAIEEKEARRPKSVWELADAYRAAHNQFNSFTEDQQKAVDKYAQGFSDAFSTAFSTVSGFKAVQVTTDEYASAQERLADATAKVKDAQAAQNRLGDLRTTSKQRADAAKAVTDAVKGQSDAYRVLNDLRSKDRPVSDQMTDYYKNTLKDAKKFSEDLQSLISKGLDPKLIEDLIKKGPEAAAPEMKAFLSTNGDALIQMANDTEETLKGLNGRVVENARLSAIAMNSDLASIAEDLPLALQIAAQKGSNESMSGVDLAKMLGVDYEEVKRTAAEFGQDWVKTAEEEAASKPIQPNMFANPKWSLGDYDTADEYLEKQSDGATITPQILIDPVYGITTTPEEYLRAHKNDPTTLTRKQSPWQRALANRSFWTGGMLPGYTPGRDVHQFYSPTGGILNLSGGEPIMRPEFGAALGGKRGVDYFNRLAMNGGVAAVRNALFKPMGSQSFATGGVFGTPSVVEVPVTSRVEHHGTTIVEKVIANDPLEFDRAIKAERKNRNAFG